MTVVQLVALAGALGWASGMRLYAAVALVGVAGWAGVPLPGDLGVLAQPLVWGAASAMALVEFVADKVPWVDSAWDALNTLIRIPAGAALAAAVFGGIDSPQWQVLAALAGGTLAATAHAAKASVRAAANTSPEPLSNWTLSLLGDAAVPALLWLAYEHPVAALVALALGSALALTLVWLLWRFVKRLFARWKNNGRPKALESH